MSKKKTNAPKGANHWDNDPVMYEFPEKPTERKVSMQVFMKENRDADSTQKLEHLQEDDFVLSIIQAKRDGKDFSELCYRNEAFLAFYERNGLLHFANVWQKTGKQLYGEVTQLEHTEDENTEYKTESTSYLWHYSRNENKQTGTAIILLRLIYRPVAVAFELSVLTEGAEMLMFKGYVNSSLNWKPF